VEQSAKQQVQHDRDCERTGAVDEARSHQEADKRIDERASTFGACAPQSLRSTIDDACIAR